MEGLIDAAIGFAIALLAAVVAWRAWRGRLRDDARPVALDESLEPPQLAWLGERQRALWQRQCERFLSEKRFIGCGGFIVEARHRQAIAGMACLLRLQAGAATQPLFPAVREILVYPDVFLVPGGNDTAFDDGLTIVDTEPQERIGEQAEGQIVLAWSSVESAFDGDDINVVIHEFAHALDSENPGSEGAPPMASHAEWASVMTAEFERLRRHRRPPVLDPYGAESPAEFWCVVAEAFFQQPAGLARHHAPLYALLCRYFEIAPVIETELAAPPGAA